MSRFVGAGKKLMSFLVPRPNVPKTEIQKKIRDLKISTQKSKAGTAKLNQTIFELKNNKPFTFKSKKGKSESNTESYKRITAENNKVIKNMLDKATENKKDGGRMGYKSGSKDYKDRDAGGGADSGKRGEAKSRMGVLINKANRRIRNSKLPESPMKEERIFNTKNERLSKIIGKENVGPGYGREVERPTKKAMGGRIGRKMGGGSDMGNTNVKKKFKGFSKLPETVQIKINKKLAKKV
jgi:hypothetical protein